MSWIGPRPELPEIANQYELEVPFYRYRLSVKPGISGWAQVNQGHVSTVKGTREKLKFDFYYIKHVSLFLDLLIYLKTVKTLITGFGAK